MNIMLQNHTFYPALGGIENYLYHVSKTLQKLGCKPVIICEKDDNQLSDFANYHGIEIIRHPYYNISKRMLYMKPKVVVRRLKHFISRHVGDIDLIISRYPHYCFATTELDLDVPIFYMPPSVFWKQVNKASSNLSVKVKFFNLMWKKILDEIERESILRSRKTIVFSKNNADSLTRYYKLVGFGVHVIPPGVDVNRFNNKKDLSLLGNLNIKEEEIVILYVGRLPPEKNVESLLKELAKVKRDDLKLLVVGDGPERKRLETLSNTLRLGGMVSFLGMRTDVEKLYSTADIFVSPSKYEPFGQVILEAMAAGLPCIAFKRVPPEYEVAAEEMIEDGVTGYCANPYNGDEFRQKLIYLIENPSIRKRMGEAGRKVCERKFTWEGHVRRLLELVNS
jgi:1,2-diacylglycerol 3-alpha-glucosyltransferase